MFIFSVDARRIEYLSEFKKNTFTGDATNQGDSISLTIYKEDAEYIKEKDITKLNMLAYKLDNSIEILGLTHKGFHYLKFDIKDFNAEENSGKKKTSYFLCILGLFCILVGRYRWKRNYRW